MFEKIFNNQHIDAECLNALNELAAQAQELGMGYE